MQRILVLQHAVGADGNAETELGVFVEAIKACGTEYAAVNTAGGEPVPRELAADTDGLIVLGGTMGVYERDRLAYLSDEIRLIRRALDDGRSVLGVCLGSQLLAAALGAPVYKAPRREVGWRPVRLAEAAAVDPLFRDLPASFDAFHWHGDRFELPPGATLLAASDLTPVQAFRWGDCAWGIQFHPEVRAASIADWSARFADEMREAGVTSSDIDDGTRRSLARQQEIGVAIMKRWLTRL